jgi:D-glycero-D-manno-heptose 1,7-bisphosphate phosphatase
VLCWARRNYPRTTAARLIPDPSMSTPAPPGRRRCLFLDRDGVINAAPPMGEYVRCWEEFRLLPEAVSWIRLFKAAGYLAIVLTNQRGIALGLYSHADLQALHTKMRAELAAQGAILDDIFYCPHEEDACDCRKPRPGLVVEAQRKWDIDLAASLSPWYGKAECWKLS